MTEAELSPPSRTPPQPALELFLKAAMARPPRGVVVVMVTLDDYIGRQVGFRAALLDGANSLYLAPASRLAARREDSLEAGLTFPPQWV